MKLLFPTVIHELQVERYKSIKKDILKFVYEEQKKDPKGLTFSNRGGWQSGPHYHNENIILSTVTKTLLPYFSNNVLDMKKEIRCDGLWMNINKKGDYNVTHDHPCCHMAGVFWINSPKEGGGIFECQSPISYALGPEIRVYTDDFKERTNCYGSYGFIPKEGTIMLFPAFLNHRVTPNTSNQDRISASFNLTFKLTAGRDWGV